MNIFEDIRNMTDEEIKMQIAMLNCINLANAAKETTDKFIGGLAQFANNLIRTFGKTTEFEYQITYISDMIQDSLSTMKDKDRQWLLSELKSQIIKKCGITNNDISEEKLTFVMINEAASAYKINKYETCANKLKNVCIEYNNALLRSLHIHLLKQEKDARQETDLKMQKRLDEISIEEKRNIYKAVMPKEFSGIGFGRVIRSETGTKYLGIVAEYLGYECFDYIRCCVMTSLRGLKELKKVSQSLLAQLLFKMYYKNEDKYIVDKRILPSYVSPDKQKEQEQQDRQFQLLIKNRLDTEQKIKRDEKQAENINGQLEAAKEKSEQLNASFNEISEKFKKLEKIKEEYVKNRHTESETKQYYSDVNETKRQLDYAELQCIKQEQKIDSLEKEKSEKEKALFEKKQEYENIKAQSDGEVKRLTEEISTKWRAFYYRFMFDESIFGKIVLTFTSSERLKIEEMLKEMHVCSDICAFETKPGCTYCIVSKGKSAVIRIQEGKINGIDRL